MKLYCLWRGLVTAIAMLTASLAAGSAFATKLPHYSEEVLAEWQQRYPRGISLNYDDVILPRLDAKHKAALENLIFKFPAKLERHDPFGFAADSAGKTVYMSIRSLKFLDELSIANAWLNRNGYTSQSTINYLLMLRGWNSPEPPPPVFEALCIPADALKNKGVDSLSKKSLATAITFVMLHELGHVIYRHGGYDGITREEARKREQAADAFALDTLARIGDVPLGVVELLVTMAYLSDQQPESYSEGMDEYKLARRTHPLSHERLVYFADQLQETASDYTGGGLTQATITGLALQIRTVAGFFNDIKRLSLLIGPTIQPADLGPMKAGEQIGRTCNAKQISSGPFSGRFGGKTTINGVEFDIEANLDQSGNRVSGRYSFGAGFADLEGNVEGDQLRYTWRLGPDTGTGELKHTNDAYEGEWKNGDSSAGGGPIRLERR